MIKEIASQSWVKYAATILSAVVLFAGIIASYAVAQYQIRELRDELDKVVVQQDGDHDKITEIANDVRWIRTRLEGMGR